MSIYSRLKKISNEIDSLISLCAENQNGNAPKKKIRRKFSRATILKMKASAKKRWAKSKKK